MTNLAAYVETLRKGVRPLLIQAGFIHREPQGVVAIDQSGGGVGLRQTRLYIYVYEVDGIVYLITIGDKTTQSQDLSDCRAFMNTLRKDG